MARADEFIGQLERYLDDEGPTPLPDSARATVRAELQTTRQTGALPRPIRSLRLRTSISALAGYALVAVAITAAALVAASFLGR
jgi:hypothetical protein